MAPDTISLGVQAGDVASSDALRPHFMDLRRFFSTLCKGPYSSAITEFALILRISGEIWTFEGEGCQRIRLQKAKSYITADVVIPKARWLGQSALDIRQYIWAECEEALRLMVERIYKARLDVDKGMLVHDLNKVRSVFLNSDGPI